MEFDLDANGILTVAAAVEGAAAWNSITVTTDKRRLSKADIARMAKEAERFKEEDERAREEVEAKNAG